jgi:hypothetical protein
MSEYPEPYTPTVIHNSPETSTSSVSQTVVLDATVHYGNIDNVVMAQFLGQPGSTHLTLRDLGHSFRLSPQQFHNLLEAYADYERRHTLQQVPSSIYISASVIYAAVSLISTIRQGIDDDQMAAAIGALDDAVVAAGLIEAIPADDAPEPEEFPKVLTKEWFFTW